MVAPGGNRERAILLSVATAMRRRVHEQGWGKSPNTLRPTSENAVRAKFAEFHPSRHFGE
jgi:hypothetical protein